MKKKWLLTVIIILTFTTSAVVRIYRGKVITGTLDALIGGILIVGAFLKYRKNY